MANDILSTSFNSYEVADGYCPTPISAAFSGLLTALARHAEAERDIEDVDVFDPAFRDWLTDAENTFTSVTTLISSIGRAEPARSEDLPLQRMTMLVDAMIGSEEPGTFARLHRLMPQFEAAFRSKQNNGVARRVNHMLLTACARMDELASLLSYEDLIEAEDQDSIDLSGNAAELTPESCVG